MAWAHLAGGDRARAGRPRLARASSSACPAGCTATSRTRPRPRRSPRSRPPARMRPGGVVYASEQAHFSVEKAARILGLELRTVPVDDEFRMLPDFPLDGRDGGRRDGRDDVVHLGRPGSGARRPLRGGGRLAPRRRRLRRLGGGLPRAPLVPRRASSAPTRSSSTRTSGSSRRSTARRSGRAGPRRFRKAFARARPTTWLPARARSTSATTARRSAGGSARSSSGPCSAATAARACRR